MYLSESKRKEIMTFYGYKNAIDKNHYQVGPDTWVYLFKDNNKKCLLIDTDYLGEFEFNIFPHLLKFDNSEFAKLAFILQREIPVKDSNLSDKTANTILFEYVD